MATSWVKTPGGRQVEVLELAPTPQVSTNSAVALAGGGSTIDARPWTSVAYTISVATNDINWSVWGANNASFTDEVAVLAPAQVVAAASSSYAVSPPVYAHYRVKIVSTVGGQHGTATVLALARA